MENINDLFKNGLKQVLIDLINSDSEIIKLLLNKTKGTSTLEKEFYTLKEVSQITGLTYVALKGRHKRKTINTAMDGNCILVPVSEVNKLLSNLNKQLPK